MLNKKKILKHVFVGIGIYLVFVILVFILILASYVFMGKNLSSDHLLKALKGSLIIPIVVLIWSQMMLTLMANKN